jgi:hypothetical protein
MGTSAKGKDDPIPTTPTTSMVVIYILNHLCVSGM